MFWPGTALRGNARPITTAVAGGMIGEIGALGGGILPNLLGQSKQHTGSYRAGFILYAAIAFIVLVIMRLVARKWTRTWVSAGGRAIHQMPINDTLTAIESESLEVVSVRATV